MRLWRVRAQGCLLAVLTPAGVACVMVAHRLARPPDAVLGRTEIGGHFVDLQDEPDARPIAGLLVYRNWQIWIESDRSERLGRPRRA